MEPTNEELPDHAASVLSPKLVGDRLFGDVGCALITTDGNRYLGVCIDTASGTGFCAEHSAMVTAGGTGSRRSWRSGRTMTALLMCCPRAVDVGNSSGRSTK